MMRNVTWCEYAAAMRSRGWWYTLIHECQHANIRLEHLVSCSLVFVSALLAVMAASTWSYEISNGVWRDMAVQFSAVLSEAADSGVDGVIYVYPNWKWCPEAETWEEVHWEYEVNFREMIQTNVSTRKVRRIRRFVLQQHGTKSK